MSASDPSSTSTRFLSLEEAERLVGEEVGVTPWLEITQARIQQFAEATGDHQFIHLDPERAKAETPFGGTIAHGFLTLSLLSWFGSQTGTVRIRDCRMVINYGLDTVRFLNPVKAGARIRARYTLLGVVEKSPGHYLIKHRAVVEIEGQEKPAMIAETLGMSVR
ncbi:MAG: MaoC family dehydratase [Pseudomonadales bacterium]|nr:MaoC family dehydratase [Pseudomonadales bacterium]